MTIAIQTEKKYTKILFKNCHYFQIQILSRSNYMYIKLG